MVCQEQNVYVLTSMINQLGRSLGEKNIHSKFLTQHDFGQLVEYTFQSLGLTLKLVELKNSLKKQFDLPLQKKTWYIEMDLSEYVVSTTQLKKYVDQSNYPTVKRSYSWTLSQNVYWEQVQSVLEETQLADCLVVVQPLERYALEHGDNKDILNYQVEFISYDRTLTSVEISEWETLITHKLQRLGDFQLR
jgi:phenylalanyl-tRNA synthetase beta subunit